LQAVQLEDAIQQSASEEEVSQLSGLLPISETNTMLAEQASACLVDNAEMLEEYFSVVIEIDDEDKIMLTGLPVLLEGYTPQTHALPMFLLRLATEVDWSEEIPCFQGVCRELASFYAELPSDADLGPHIQHQLFPRLLRSSRAIEGRWGFPRDETVRVYCVFNDASKRTCL
jgi:DNA mismatch repair protein MLH1